MEDKKLLQVGDIIYGYSAYGISRYVIDRVTATQAISNNTKFRREYFEGGSIFKFGESHGWNSESYSIETSELKEKYYRFKIIAILKGTDFSKLTTDQLAQIYKIVKSERR